MQMALQKSSSARKAATVLQKTDTFIVVLCVFKENFEQWRF